MSLTRINLSAEESRQLDKYGSVHLPRRRLPPGREVLVARPLRVITDEIDMHGDEPRARTITVQYPHAAEEDIIDIRPAHAATAALWSAGRVDQSNPPLIESSSVPHYLLKDVARVLNRTGNGVLIGQLGSGALPLDLHDTIHTQIQTLHADIQTRTHTIREQIGALRAAGETAASDVLERLLNDVTSPGQVVSSDQQRHPTT